MLTMLLLQAAVGSDAPDRLLAQHRALIRDTIATCPRTAPADDEIVICGRGERSPYRLPLPVEHEPGRVVRGRGDVPSGADAMAAANPCPTGGSTCHAPIDLFKVGRLLLILGRKIADDD